MAKPGGGVVGGGEEDLAGRIEQAKRRVEYGMARAAEEYDRARSDLGAHGERMETERQRLVAELDRLAPKVDRFLHAPTPQPLTQATARVCLRYLETAAELEQVIAAGRIAGGAS